MTHSPIHIVCPSCSTINRLPQAKLNDQPVCGKCGKSLLTTHPVEVSDKSFNRYLTKSDLPLVVDFWAEWCGPCKQFAPTFKQLAADMDKLACFIKVNSEHNQSTASNFNIRSIPTLMIFHQGKEITCLSGALPPAQFKQWLAQNLPGI